MRKRDNQCFPLTHYVYWKRLYPHVQDHGKQATNKPQKYSDEPEIKYKDLTSFLNIQKSVAEG